MNINYELPDLLHKALKIEAARQGVTLKQLVIDALRLGIGEIQRQDGRPPEDIQDA